MDTYRVNANELWYYILYPIVGIIGITGIIGTIEIINFIAQGQYQYIYALVIACICLPIIINYLIHHQLKTSSLIDLFLTNSWLQTGFIIIVGYTIYLIIGYIMKLYENKTRLIFTKAASPQNYYEPFTNSTTIADTLQQVQQATQTLQKSLDMLTTATDDTCSVIKGIEQKFLDNETSPTGDGDPPSAEEAKAIKARTLPAATKKWNQKKQDWSDTHGQIPVVECFTDGSLSELVAANQQLRDLLASAPVQRVVAQVKSLQTSVVFAQKDIDGLVTQLEQFDNPTPDPTPSDTITISTTLIAQAQDVQSQIKQILDSTKTLKNNYVALNTKANDPTTLNNLAANKS
jgi:hypothetical protein